MFYNSSCVELGFSIQEAAILNDLVGRKKYMRKETKSKLYNATVRPIMTYALETRAET